ncbi:ParB N-terminal domain-containing protein [Idiomarina aminovorans]|uniref:ParB N-terminal domain-containing protein n=1 Tax=Idiomarina aminovorans TaxID=2914829 RepID=UPI00200571DD|nr:ParB N-terminal domain-containing protein [Idiomarina sp. ATCH4]MCK7459950.1 hypothetical protein [Idiomarina sp. ATCH4]
MTSSQVELNKVTAIEPELLKLDTENPRLFGYLDSSSEAPKETLIKELISFGDLGELIQSIAENGYLSIEPLVIFKRDNKDDLYTVLEGNRRLAAIFLLKDKDLARKLKISVPKSLNESVLDSMKSISVYRVKDENEARAFIGFKHVNGPHKWDSYAKAQYAYKWYKEGNGITIEDIANKLGDKNNTVRSLLSGVFVLEQAKRNDIYDINKDRTSKKFSFSHLYTALNRTEYRNYLALKPDWNNELHDDPIPSASLSNLKDILIGIYGYKPDNRPAVVTSQNPDLKKFGQVLSDENAIDSFRNGGDLTIEDLYRKSRDPLDLVKESIVNLNDRLDKLSSTLDRVSGTDSSFLVYSNEFKKKVQKVLIQLDITSK